jgi:hypothetical protein
VARARMELTGMSADRPTPSALVELRAAAEHARWRVARYRRRMYLGRGEPQRLAELERVARGADDRLRRAQALDHR